MKILFKINIRGKGYGFHLRGFYIYKGIVISKNDGWSIIISLFDLGMDRTNGNNINY